MSLNKNSMFANIGSQVLELTHNLTAAVETELNPAIASPVEAIDHSHDELVAWVQAF